jgi:hypothetical protein
LLPSLKREVRLCFKYYSEWLNVKYWWLYQCTDDNFMSS